MDVSKIEEKVSEKTKAVFDEQLKLAELQDNIAKAELAELTELAENNETPQSPKPAKESFPVKESFSPKEPSQ